MQIDSDKVFPKRHIAAGGFQARIHRHLRRLRRYLRQYGGSEQTTREDGGQQTETSNQGCFSRKHPSSLCACPGVRCVKEHSEAVRVPPPLRNRSWTFPGKPAQPRSLPGKQCTSPPRVRLRAAC